MAKITKSTIIHFHYISTIKDFKTYKQKAEEEKDKISKKSRREEQRKREVTGERLQETGYEERLKDPITHNR